MTAPNPGAPKKGDHVFLIDGSSFVFRAYFAMFKAAQSRGRSFTRSDGLPIGGVLTFCNMLWKILREGLNEVKPTHLAVVFDYSGKSFRNEIYTEYKGHRPEPPDELIPQFPLMRDAVRAFGLVPIEQEGYEADDLIATYARVARADGADVTIIAGDKDLMQLVRDGVLMYDPMPGNERRIGRAEVIERFGVPPGKGHRGAGADRGCDRQCAGRARHRRQDGGAADRRIWRSRNAARARPRDQAGEAAAIADRVRRAGADVEAARAAGRPGRACLPAERMPARRARRQEAHRLSQGHGVQHADATRRRGDRDRPQRGRGRSKTAAGRKRGRGFALTLAPGGRGWFRAQRGTGWGAYAPARGTPPHPAAFAGRPLPGGER